MASNRKGMRCVSFFLFLYSVVVILLLAYFFTQHFWRAAPVNSRHQISEEESVYPFREILHTPVPQSLAVSSSPKTEKQKPAFQQGKKSHLRKNLGNIGSGSGTPTLEETFQPVNNRTIFVYSAYLRNVMHPHEVVVVAIVNRSAMVPPVSQHICCVYGGGGDEGAESSIVQGKLRIFPDHHGRVFSAAYISCPAPKTLTTSTSSSSSPPVTVSLSTPGDQHLANRVRVQTPGPRQYRFLVCFSPVHSAFNDAVQMVANLELAQVLGAERAVVYNTSVSPRVSQVLRRYVSAGFLQVKNWTQPPEPIHYKGQLGAINDCLLQNTNRTEFIVFMDFDEMIVPRVHASWSALVRALFSEASPSDFVSDGNNVLKMKESFISRIRGNTRQHNAKNARVSEHSPVIGAVKFPSAIFLKDKPANLTSDDRDFAVKFNVKYLLKQRKTQQLWTRRTKSVVNPRTIYIMGIHLVHSFLHGEKSLLVNETVGLCQHYRWYSKVPSAKDTNILRFSSVLVKRMKQVFKELDSV